jgi:hypothetical protein
MVPVFRQSQSGPSGGEDLHPKKSRTAVAAVGAAAVIAAHSQRLLDRP